MPEKRRVANELQRRLAAIHAASERVSDAQDQLARRRLEYRQAIAEAVDAGWSQSALSRELGVSRQQVSRLIEES